MRYLGTAASLLKVTTKLILCGWARLHGYNFEYSCSAIDPDVGPLVKALNTGGRVRTIDSCAGHVGRSFPPYVSFRASVRVASRIDELLREMTSCRSKRLKVDWLVVGMFDEKAGFFFRLFSPQYEAASQSVLSSALRFGIGRHAVIRDIRTMAVAIEQSLLNDARNNKDQKHTNDDE